MEHLYRFNGDLLDELRIEATITGVALEDLAFERLASTLEGEAEIDTSDRCAWRGAASGKNLRIDGHGGNPRETDC